MDMTEQVLLFYVYGAAGVALLFLALALQRSKINRLEREIDDITLKFQHQAAAPKQVRDELFLACPYPVCFVDMKGKILAANTTFRLLVGNNIQSLAELDKSTGAELRRFPLEGNHYNHRLATLRTSAEGGLRQFNIIGWPVWGSQVQTGAVLSFHEQTHVLRRKTHQLHFEQQLVSYLAFLAIQLSKASESNDIHRAEVVDSYSKEIHLLTSYLQQMHHQLRQPNPHETLDIIKLCRELTSEYRTELRAKELHVTTTFPKEGRIVAHYGDIQLALRTLFAGVLLQAGHSTDVRIDVYMRGKRAVLDIMLPERVLSELDVQHIFAFGSTGEKVSSSTRLSRLQLAMVRELIAKYNGQLTVHSHAIQGTLYRLILVGSPKE